MSVRGEDMHYPDPLKKPRTKVTVLSSELVPRSSLNRNRDIAASFLTSARGIRTIG